MVKFSSQNIYKRLNASLGNVRARKHEPITFGSGTREYSNWSIQFWTKFCNSMVTLPTQMAILPSQTATVHKFRPIQANLSPLRPNFSLQLDFNTTTGKPLSMIGKAWGNNLLPPAAMGSPWQQLATNWQHLALKRGQFWPIRPIKAKF